jgi:hypothetical protein
MLQVLKLRRHTIKQLELHPFRRLRALKYTPHHIRARWEIMF